MIRWLLIALFIYLIFKFISRQGKVKGGRKPFIRVQFGRSNTGTGEEKGPSRRKHRSLDQIEEAEYEDITENKESRQ